MQQKRLVRSHLHSFKRYYEFKDTPREMKSEINMPGEIMLLRAPKCDRERFLEPTCGFWPCQLLQLRGRDELKRKKSLRCLLLLLYNKIYSRAALSLLSVPLFYACCASLMCDAFLTTAAFFLLLVTAPKRTMTFLI